MKLHTTHTTAVVTTASAVLRELIYYNHTKNKLKNKSHATERGIVLSGLLGEGLGVGMVCVMLELLVAERDEKFNSVEW